MCRIESWRGLSAAACESGSARSPGKDGPRHPRDIRGRSRRADEGRLIVQAVERSQNGESLASLRKRAAFPSP